MTDPTSEVALALHGAPGVYAVLVGSGVSRGARVPTGWEVTLDLITRLAVATEGEAPNDPQRWYVDKYKTDPDYSDILERLAPTPAERQARLRTYFEPSEQEREEGMKIPTAAHHALADLAAHGAVRVLLTTNFDRLLEQALDAEGVAYDLWTSPGAIAGGVPLAHGNVVVVKLHGDYRDTRLRNTLAELETYDPAIDALLDRVLDEFGLIVIGWSGVWDAALRSAVLRAPNRRYRTFWAARHGGVAEKAEELVQHRAATIVPIEDADTFLTTVRDKHEALREFDRPHPASVQLAVAMVKRYLPDERDRIRLTDVVIGEARRLHDRTNAEHYPSNLGRQAQWTDLADRIHGYEADAEIMVAVIAHLGAYGNRVEHAALTARAMELVADATADWSGDRRLGHLRRYPALVCLYALGLPSVAHGNWHQLRAAMLDAQWTRLEDKEPLGTALHPERVFEESEPLAQLLATGDADSRQYSPISDYLHKLLRPPLSTLIDTDEQYDEVFDRFEYVAGVVAQHVGLLAAQQRGYVRPGHVGRLRYRHKYSQTLPPVEWFRQRRAELAPALFADSDDPTAAMEAAADSYHDEFTQIRANTR